MGFIRLVLFGFFILSVIYICLSLYSRSVRREKLEDEWDTERPEGISRADFVANGIKAYNNSLRPKLLLLVYVIPTIAVGATIYIINTN